MATEIEAPRRAKGMTHKLIADTAKGMAGEHYEQLARNNRFYAAWPDQAEYVRQKWELYLDVARQVLTAMLGDPNRPEDQKEVIADAILRDGAVNPKRMAKPEKPRYFLGNS